jgi:hypothetical protein
MVEDRIFELLGEKTPDQIIAALGLDEREGIRLIRKVIRQRGGTPRSIAIREEIERLISLPI